MKTVENPIIIRRILEEVANLDQYSCLYEFLEDIKYNGKVISFKAPQWNSVVIDHGIVNLKQNIIVNHVEMTGVEYALRKLEAQEV